MRTSLVLAACLPLFACHTVQPSAVDIEDAIAVADASYRATSAKSPAVEVVAVDPVTAQLLKAVVAAHDTLRRVLLENLANVNTIGYKRRVMRTATKTVVGADGEVFQIPVMLGIESQFSTGTLQLTDRNLDVAIDGDGFFAVRLPDGSTGYTRDGSFQVNVEGKIVTGSGNVLLPEIKVPNDTLAISIDPQGGVSVSTASSPDSATVLGQLSLHRFVNPNCLRQHDGVFTPSDGSGAPITNTPGTTGLGLLKQGFLERSNVQSTNELMNLQVTERQHEVLVRVLRQFGYVAP